MRHDLAPPDEHPEPTVGFAEASDTPSRPATVLWVPDPESRRGWREWYVQKEPRKPNGRPIGFGRPRGR